MSKSQQFSFDFESLAWDELADIQQELIKQARKACDTAYAPYSNFTVGAALELDNGEIMIGSNQENAAYPSGLCAERVAVFSAASQYPRAVIKRIAITARRAGEDEYLSVTPCGSCRQVLLEHEEKQLEKLEIILQLKEQWTVIPQSAYMLPFCFDKESLG